MSEEKIDGKPADNIQAEVGFSFKQSFDFEFVDFELTRLIGRVLTTVDASITEPVQRKAVKDLVRQEFREMRWKLEQRNWESSPEKVSAISSAPPIFNHDINA